jgi:hypothetical protein
MLLHILIVSTCALLTAIIAQLGFIGFRRNHFVFTLIFIFLFPVSLLVAYEFAVPGIRDWRARADARILIRGDRYFSVLLTHHPLLRPDVERAMTALVREGVPPDVARRLAFRRLQPLTYPYFLRHAAHAGDRELATYARELRLALRELDGKPGDPCYWVSIQHLTADANSLGQLSDPQTLDLSLAMAGVIESGATDPQAAPSEARGRELTQLILRNMEIQYGTAFVEQLDILDALEHSAEDRRLVCAITQALYQESIRLPEPARGQWLRHHFSGLQP